MSPKTRGGATSSQVRTGGCRNYPPAEGLGYLAGPVQGEEKGHGAVSAQAVEEERGLGESFGAVDIVVHHPDGGRDQMDELGRETAGGEELLERLLLVLWKEEELVEGLRSRGSPHSIEAGGEVLSSARRN